MVHFVKCVQELRLLLDCVVSSFFQLIWCVGLVAAVIMLFALVLMQGIFIEISEEHELDYLTRIRNNYNGKIDSVAGTTLLLFQCSTNGMEWSNLYELLPDGVFCKAVLVMYIAFFFIVAWNIITSTFVEKVMRLALPDIDLSYRERKRAEMAYAKELKDLLAKILNRDSNGVISLAEFKESVNDPKVRSYFVARDFDLKDVELFFHMIASIEDGECGKHEVEINTFVNGCLRLRGLAASLDLQALHFEMRSMFASQIKRLTKLEDMFRLLVQSDPLRHKLSEDSPGRYQMGVVASCGSRESPSLQSARLSEEALSPRTKQKIRL